MTSFCKLDKNIVKILHDYKINEPTEIQTRVIPSAANGHDMIGVSQTGTGKTLAFILPIIQQILVVKKTYHCLVITPTRELAHQIVKCIKMFDGINIKSACLVGGEKMGPQIQQLNNRPHIIVGTPGRITEHIEKNKNFRIGLIKKLVFDEADRFFEKDFDTELNLIMQKLTRKTQTLMFTATMTERTKFIAEKFMKKPKLVEIAKKYESVSKLNEYYAFIGDSYKQTVLVNHLTQYSEKKAIVFVELCVTAKKLELLLSDFGINCKSLYGNLGQTERSTILQEFRNNEFNVLIATDVASRGLDIVNVDQVYNYDLPLTAKDYMHRVGRTARAGKDGDAINYVTQYDIEQFQKLEYVMNKKIETEISFTCDNYDAVKKVYENASKHVNALRTFKKGNK